MREDFLKWLESKNYSKVHFGSILSNLERHVGVISSPMDVVNAFAGLTDGQQHCLNRAVKALCNFLEVMGYDEGWLKGLRKAVPKDNIGIDVRVPSEQEIIISLRQVEKTNQVKYKAIWNMALDSGLRLTEIVRFIKMFNPAEIEKYNGFYVAPIGYFRRVKLAYYGFFTEYTFGLIEALPKSDIEDLSDKSASTYFRKNSKNVTAYKYLRKFANDIMTDEVLNIPESVADFFEGRTPKSVGARHYMKLKRKAVGFYPRYAEYLATLRSKAGLN